MTTETIHGIFEELKSEVLPFEACMCSDKTKITCQEHTAIDTAKSQLIAFLETRKDKLVKEEQSLRCTCDDSVYCNCEESRKWRHTCGRISEIDELLGDLKK